MLKSTPVREKHLKLVIFSLALLVIGMFFSQKITGRLAYSNIFQIASFMFILPVIFKTFNAKMYIFVTLTFSMVFVAESFVENHYLVESKLEHVIFFFMITIYMLIFYKLASKYDIEPTITKAYKVFVLPVFIYLVCFATKQFIIDGRGYIDIGFDDKSHAVIVCSFFAFVTLVLLKSSAKYIISLIFMALALLTISRLSIIFLVFYVVCFFYSFINHTKQLLKEDKKSAPLKLYLNFVLFIITISFGLWYYAENHDSFLVFERADSIESIQNANSTKAHILLILYGVTLKFQNVFNFVFGIGPGNYSLTLLASGIDMSEFMLADPGGIITFSKGLMPMHSAHFSFFVEFPIIFFVAYVFLLAKILILLIKEKLFILKFDSNGHIF